MTGVDRRALWHEIETLSAVPEPMAEDEISVSEFAAHKQIRWGLAYDVLQRLVAEGKMTRRPAILRSRRRGWAYWVVPGTDDSHE